MPHRIADPRARAEAQLRISEERFRHIFENASIGIAEVALDGYFAAVNGTFCHITGYSREELLDRTFQEITHPDDVAEDEAQVAQLVDGAMAHFVMEKRYIRKDGSIVPVHLTVSAVRGLDNEVSHFVSIAEDISERKAAEEALRRSELQFRSVFEHASIGIAVADMQGWLTQCNRAFEKLLGYTQDELRHIRFSSLVHPEDARHQAARIDELRRGLIPHVELENRYVHKSGRPVWVHKFVAMLFDANHVPSRVMALVTDITSQRAEQEIQREEMRKKDEFIAVLAHELRNPLAPIRTSVSVLRALDSPDPTLARCRDVIDRQVGHMARLIDDLLDVSRLSRGELRLQRSPVRLARVLDDAAELADALLVQHRQRLVMDGVPPELVIDADAARLTQVVGNLLHNAAKYSPPDTEVRLHVALDGDTVLLRVVDQGVGIPAEQIDRVFDLFAQTDNARELSKGGLGIGLALARRLVELHGGAIAAESAGPGRGSVFTVRLPLRHPALEAAAAHTPAPDLRPKASAPAMRILVADDNVDAAEMLGVLFEQAGCSVRRVHDGESAVLEAERFRPALAVLDIGMPGMDGNEACRRIRRTPWGVAMRIVALTGRGRESDRQLSLASGFDQHFVKPIDTDALLQLLDS